MDPTGCEFFFIILALKTVHSNQETPAETFHHFFKNYSKFYPPGYFSDTNNQKNEGLSNHDTDVQFLFYPVLISSMNLKAMDFELDYIMMATWVDWRLNDDFAKLATDFHEFEVPQEVSEILWKPILQYSNCKGCSHTVFGNPGEKLFTKIDNNIVGFRLGFRHMQLFTCSYALANYPFDLQKCSVRIEIIAGTFNYHVNIRPKALTSMQIDTISVPPEFYLLGFTITNCSSHHANLMNVSSFEENKGKNVCLDYTFYVRRITFQYMLMTYIPSCLIVILSWISFWIDVERSPARVTLGLTSLLTLATQLNSVQTSVPWGGTLKAIDVWMFTCCIMVFASLIEFFLVNFCYVMNKRRKTVITSNNIAVEKDVTPVCVNRCLRVLFCFIPYKCCRRICKRLITLPTSSVDSMAAIIFPLVFFFFNIIYWGVYGWHCTSHLYYNYENYYET